NYFDVLGVRALVGRTFAPDDDRPGAEPVVVLSHGYWQRRFGGDRNAVGSVVQIANVRATIIGVTPPDFTGVQQAVSEARDITIPLALDPQLAGAPLPSRPGGALGLPRLQQPTTWWLQVMGRLKPGMTREQAQAYFAGVFDASAREGWAGY